MNQTPDRHAESACPQCGAAVLTRRHCKTLCLQCGYVESCEDNFLPNRANPGEGTAAREDDAPCNN